MMMTKEEDLLLAETEELLRQIEMNPLFAGVDNLASSSENNETDRIIKYHSTECPII